LDNPAKKHKQGATSQPPVPLTAVERELGWTRFAFELEEKLASLQDNEMILHAFADHLKGKLAYDYLEVSLQPNSNCDVQPAEWVRNDTGYGGKLLSLILAPEFMHGLRWRRRPLVVDVDDPQVLVKNPELLHIMDLNCGLLIPLCQGTCAHGVMKLFFRDQIRFDAETQKWLLTSAGILYRSLRRATLYVKAQKMATIDGLTGLYNRRYFMEQLAKEFVRSRRYRNWLSLIIVDIDYFKNYNDANGHLAGDKVLQRVARAIRENVREIDLVARWGGEEFVLLLPEISGENGMVVAEKIRRGVEAQRFKNERKQPNRQLTISLGVAQNSISVKNHLEMFNQADAALYRAKLEGRNRCVFAK
jgi:diguanylate cyclase (GGDEF)-like protein